MYFLKETDLISRLFKRRKKSIRGRKTLAGIDKYRISIADITNKIGAW